MSFDPVALCAMDIPETFQRYGWSDAALYALGVGAGIDPVDEVDLAFLDERRIAVLPTFAVVLGYAGFWVEQLPTGIDVSQVLQGEQSLRLSSPLAADGEIRRKTWVTDIVDRGPGRGALIYISETVSNVSDGQILAALTSTILCRAEGGKGGTRATAIPPHPMPSASPDRRLSVAASPQQALIYRLSGDLNPLHSDPVAARAAGFSRPVLHGLATFGTLCRVLLRELCGGEVGRFRALSARFTGIVFPGEPLDVEIWQESNGLASFRASVADRGTVVVDNGRFEFGAM